MAAGAGLLAGLALAGIAPFSNLLRTVDPDWFAVIQIRSMYCLLALWPRDFWIQTAGIFAWASAALALAAPAHRRFLAAVFLVGAGGLACAFLGGDIAHNQLVLELQPWRSLWLMQLVAHITMPLVIAAALARTSFDASRGTVLLATGLILFSSLARLSRNASAENINFTFFSLALVAAACAVIATQLLPQHRNRRTVALAFALSGLALLSLALWRWDARSPWLRYVASSEHPPRDLAQLLPAGASVYWEDGLEMLWFRMRRPSYFSCEQATGALFYRQTAMTYRYRAASFWPLRTSDFTRWDNCAILDPRPPPQRNRAGLQNLCRREPELDYVVLKAPLDGVMPKIWTAPVLFQELQGSARAVSEPFYIYGCSLVR